MSVPLWVFPILWLLVMCVIVQLERLWRRRAFDARRQGRLEALEWHEQADSTRSLW